MDVAAPGLFCKQGQLLCNREKPFLVGGDEDLVIWIITDICDPFFQGMFMIGTSMLSLDLGDDWESYEKCGDRFIIRG